MRRQSFYRYLMSLRDPNKHDEITQFANDAFYDQGFPKQADDYHEVSGLFRNERILLALDEHF